MIMTMHREETGIVELNIGDDSVYLTEYFWVSKWQCDMK